MISDKQTLMRQAIRNAGTDFKSVDQEIAEVVQENATLRAEVERLTRELETSRAAAVESEAQVGVLTRERDAAREGIRVKSVEDAFMSLLGKTVERGFRPPEDERWAFVVPAAVYNALSRDLSEKFRMGPVPMADENASLTLNSMFGAIHLAPDVYAPRMIPQSHAEKVLVAVAKEAARVGAEDFQRRAVVRLRGRWDSVAEELDKMEVAP